MKRKTRENKNQKGITLVALVVTIVVLLILAGISINLVLGENGIVAKSKEAKAKTEQDQINTETILNELENWIDEQISTSEGTESELFVVSEDGALSLKYYDDYKSGAKEWTIENLVIPEEVNGITVTKIQDSAFMSQEVIMFKNIKTITIPNGVVSIGESAFYGCSGLIDVTIPDSVLDIDGRAFANCSSLTSITIPNSVTELGRCAFANSGLTNITIPSHITKINCLFPACTNLRSITIPDSVQSMDQGSFSGCSSLTTVYYTGTEQQWSEIYIPAGGNEPLLSATIIYNY